MEQPQPRIVGRHLAPREDRPCDRCGEPATVIVATGGQIAERCAKHTPQNAKDVIGEIFTSALAKAEDSAWIGGIGH